MSFYIFLHSTLKKMSNYFIKDNTSPQTLFTLHICHIKNLKISYLRVKKSSNIIVVW